MSSTYSAVVRVPTCVIPLTVAVPKSCIWANIPVNTKTEDDAVLRSLPYFGDEDLTGVDVSNFDKVPDELEPELCGEAEELTVLHMVSKYKSRSSGLIRPEVYSALSSVLGLSLSEIAKAYDRVVEGYNYVKNV